MHLEDISLGVSASANGYVANHTEGTVSLIGKTLGGKAKSSTGVTRDRHAALLRAPAVVLGSVP